ncbi:hypothetical protein Cantr_05964 [Candida viswanathii]|uniref:Uncharacterized protein n=1 Tax=Candida viswanathii TaxID=5486 RepID=A0A367XRM3_9ASCO|nr:hypothetical protein Cantr_05964 [Candida viswanathii]
MGKLQNVYLQAKSPNATIDGLFLNTVSHNSTTYDLLLSQNRTQDWVYDDGIGRVFIYHLTPLVTRFYLCSNVDSFYLSSINTPVAILVDNNRTLNFANSNTLHAIPAVNGGKRTPGTYHVSRDRTTSGAMGFSITLIGV